MVLWLFLVPFSLTAMILCYATNPIAVLFCDENAEVDTRAMIANRIAFSFEKEVK